MTNSELDKYVESFINGDKDAFNIIYKETYNSVYYTIYAIAKDNTIVDDYVQDTYIKVIEKIHSYRLGTSFKAWICRIAHNQTINSEIEHSKVKLSDEYAEMLVAPKKNDCIEKALELLDGDVKKVFIYLIVDGLSVKETAEIMGENINRIYYLNKKMEAALKNINEKY